MPIIKTKQVFSGDFSTHRKKQKMMSKKKVSSIQEKHKVSTPQYQGHGWRCEPENTPDSNYTNLLFPVGISSS